MVSIIYVPIHQNPVSCHQMQAVWFLSINTTRWLTITNSSDRFLCSAWNTTLNLLLGKLVPLIAIISLQTGWSEKKLIHNIRVAHT